METNYECMNTIIILTITFRLWKKLNTSNNYANVHKHVLNTRYSDSSAQKLSTKHHEVYIYGIHTYTYH